jgi:hypothetical protein
MKKTFIEYDKITGEIGIIRKYDGEMIPEQVCVETHSILEVESFEGNGIENKIVDGKIERKTEEEIATSNGKWELSPEEKLIQKKMGDLLRQMAIDELKKEGKIS